MAMSQLEDIQLASECMGLEVTREVGARVRRNLERDCADRKKQQPWSLMGCLSFQMWFKVRERSQERRRPWWGSRKGGWYRKEVRSGVQV